MNPSENSWTVVAHLLRPQGRRGEILAELMTDFPERFTAGSKVYLARSSDGSPDPLAVEVISSWLPTGHNQGRIVLGLGGSNSMEAAERLSGMYAVVPTAERVPLDDDAVYTSDLVGCEIYDCAALVGRIREVQFPTTADGKRRLSDAAPLLAVDHGGREVLIPFVKGWLTDVNVAQRRVTMTLPEGLVDTD